MSKETVLLVEDLHTYYFTLGGVVRAVDGVDLEVYRGELVALVGESGCGKTTLGYSIMRLIMPPGRIVKGKIILDGINILELDDEEMRDIRWRKVSMIFQGAMNSLNPVMKVGDQIIEALLYHNAISSVEEGRSIVKKLFELVNLDFERMNSYPHELSGGMKQRVVIAMALALNPDIVIADEPTTALDVTTQAKIMKMINDIRRKMGISIILITHDLPLVAEVADRVYIMYAGKIVEAADVYSMFKEPKHPYSQGLLSAIPSIKGPKRRLEGMPGEPPDLRRPPQGCRFHPRCAYVMDICRTKEPVLKPLASGTKRIVSCWLYDDSYSKGG